MKTPKPKKEIENLEFEIEFYENILKKKADFVQALTALGNAYTQKGLYEKGLEIDKKLIRLRPDDPIVFYNLACSYSLLQQIDLALEALTKAIELGYDDFDYMQADADLANIRRDERFNATILKLRVFKEPTT